MPATVRSFISNTCVGHADEVANTRMRAGNSGTHDAIDEVYRHTVIRQPDQILDGDVRIPGTAHSCDEIGRHAVIDELDERSDGQRREAQGAQSRNKARGYAMIGELDQIVGRKAAISG